MYICLAVPPSIFTGVHRPSFAQHKGDHEDVQYFLPTLVLFVMHHVREFHHPDGLPWLSTLCQPPLSILHLAALLLPVPSCLEAGRGLRGCLSYKGSRKSVQASLEFYT